MSKAFKQTEKTSAPARPKKAPWPGNKNYSRYLPWRGLAPAQAGRMGGLAAPRKLLEKSFLYAHIYAMRLGEAE